MQEYRVQIGDEVYPLDPNFVVIATLNPTQMDGTYTLPDSQLDRFALCMKIEQPTLSQLEATLKFSFEKSGESKPVELVGFPDLSSMGVVPEDWFRVCSKIQSFLSSSEAIEAGAHALGVRAFQSWLRSSLMLSALREKEYLSTECCRDLLLPSLMHRFGPFVDSNLSSLLKGVR